MSMSMNAATDIARTMLQQAMMNDLRRTADMPGKHISGYIHFPPLSGLPKPSARANLMGGTILDTRTYEN